MKPISCEKEVDTITLLKKQMSNIKVANDIDLMQSKVNRIRKKTLSCQEEVTYKLELLGRSGMQHVWSP
jgi:hypothetical protein